MMEDTPTSQDIPRVLGALGQESDTKAKCVSDYTTNVFKEFSSKINAYMIL